MNPWLALSLGLLLGQTPEITPSLPPDADTQDPAALELRDAWERALLNADATDEGQEYTDGTVQMPVLEVGGSNEADRTVPVRSSAAAQPSGTDVGAAGMGAAGIGGAGSAGATEDAQAQAATPPAGNEARSTGNLQRDVEVLRAQVQELQGQLQAQQQESSTRTQVVEQQLTGMQARAEELERMRQQRLSELERAGEWLVAADQALAVGELDIGDALTEADSALAGVLRSARDAGGGHTVLVIEDARRAIARALESTGHRDTYQARWDLFDADQRLREARRLNLDQPTAATVTR